MSTVVGGDLRGDARRRAEWLGASDMRKKRRRRRYRSQKGFVKQKSQVSCLRNDGKERKQGGVHDVDVCDCVDCVCERTEREIMCNPLGS